MENTKKDIELADIFSDQATHFLNNHNLCPEQQKAFNAIIQCRTAALGGHVDRWDNCGYIRQSYNSCRNRHCPKCQFIKKELWVDKLTANLLPVKHFHIVFTIPSCLHKLFYINQATAYSLFFKAAGKALIQCAANPEFIGAQAGAVGILHTWGQTLVYHPHIHMIVPAGGLSDDQMEWVPAGRKFFLPVKALSAVYRGILCRLIEQAVAQEAIKLPDGVCDFSTSGFYKIRYYGFMAICNMKLKLQTCFELIGKVAFLPVFEGLTALEVWRNITGGDPLHCPKCNTGKMIHQLQPATTQYKSD